MRQCVNQSWNILKYGVGSTIERLISCLLQRGSCCMHGESGMDCQRLVHSQPLHRTARNRIVCNTFDFIQPKTNKRYKLISTLQCFLLFWLTIENQRLTSQFCVVCRDGHVILLLHISDSASTGPALASPARYSRGSRAENSLKIASCSLEMSVWDPLITSVQRFS